VPMKPGKMQIIALLTGRLQVSDSSATALLLAPGQFCLVPACLAGVNLRAQAPATFLRIEA
jgi:hypothetical protein